MGAPLSQAEFRAMAEIARQRRLNTGLMFQGTKLKFGAMDSLKTGKNLLKKGRSIHKTSTKLASNVASGGGPNPVLLKKTAEEFITTCAGVDGIEDVMEVITGEALSNLIGEITPFVGILLSSKKAAVSWKKVIEDGRNLYSHSEYRTGFLPSDPLAAADAVKIIIERDLAKDSVTAVRQTAVAGTKIAGLFADLGTATTAGVGLANAIADLLSTLAVLGLEIKDMKAGNKELTTPGEIDIKVFQKSPILGCYLLTCSDTSMVANFFVADIGLPGWMDKVEALKKHKMDPLLKVATNHIKSSRLRLEGLSSDKGTHTKKNFFASIRSKVTKQIVGKIRG